MPTVFLFIYVDQNVVIDANQNLLRLRPNAETFYYRQYGLHLYTSFYFRQRRR